jgi:hypothetical protein
VRQHPSSIGPRRPPRRLGQPTRLWAPPCPPPVLQLRLLPVHPPAVGDRQGSEASLRGSLGASLGRGRSRRRKICSTGAARVYRSKRSPAGCRKCAHAPQSLGRCRHAAANPTASRAPPKGKSSAATCTRHRTCSMHATWTGVGGLILTHSETFSRWRATRHRRATPCWPPICSARLRVRSKRTVRLLRSRARGGSSCTARACLSRAIRASRRPAKPPMHTAHMRG